MSRVLKLVLASGFLAASAALVATAPSGATSTTMYYLSLGDSYSVGYQPLPTPGATSGYTAVVAAKKKMVLENFGCGGATSSSILTFADQYCGVSDAINNPAGYGPAAATDVGPAAPGQTQVQAADAFIAAHPNQIGLITVSIGGNDITPCAGASVGHPVNSATDPVTCVENGVAPITANIKTLVGDLNSALLTADGATAAAKVRIVGLTYPDVLLGLWVNSGPGGSPPDVPTYPPSATNKTLVTDSQLAFKYLINQALQTGYLSVASGRFADVTTATGAYIALTKTKTLNISALGLGKVKGVPQAVVDVCKLTWYCQLGNIHANTAGYNTIAKVVLKAAKK